MEPVRPLCQATVCNHRVCPYYAGGAFYSRFCFKHTSEKRIQPDPETCQVCLEDMPVQFRTSCCKSAFCRDCLKKHAKVGGTDCPKCRAPMRLDPDSGEYMWLNLNYQAKLLKKKVKEATFLESPEAMNAHILKLMDKEKHELEDTAKKMYDEMMKAIQDSYAERVAQWNNNTDGWKDDTWKYASAVPRMMENLNLVRSARHKDEAMARVGLRLATEIREALDDATPKDILDMSEDVQDFVQRLTEDAEASEDGDGGEDEEDEEDEEEDGDYEDDDEEEWETESEST
jgi:hypothetical protein